MNVKTSFRLALVSLAFGTGCASIDGTPEPTTARPSASRASGSEVTNLDEAQRRIRDLETQVERNVSDYQRIADVAREFRSTRASCRAAIDGKCRRLRCSSASSALISRMRGRPVCLSSHSPAVKYKAVRS